MIYNRSEGTVSEEKVYESKTMDFLYNTALGGVLTAVLRLPAVSMIYGLFQRRKASQKKIRKLVSDYDMNVSCSGYRSFNDFIIRKEKRMTESAKNILISPADGLVLCSVIENDTVFSLKGRDYSLSSLLRDKQSAALYEGGTALIIRLRVYDYHRFCFIDDGFIKYDKKIRGYLDSVNTVATGKFTLTSNYRRIYGLCTQNFGDVVFAEIGAMLVGRIVQTHKDNSFLKAQEKGYFEFGGSSIVLLLKKGAADIDPDILQYSSEGIETKVGYGERIGVRRD